MPDILKDDLFDFSWMVGRDLVVSFAEPSRWFFSLGDALGISVECPWRLLEKGRIAISSDDHGQQYGQPAPINAAALVTSMLAGSIVRRIEVQEGTADLLIVFDEDIQLEIVPFSSGYESWQVSAPDGACIVAKGGGELAAWKTGV